MKNIKVYSTPTCPHCVLLKQYLEDNKIPFVGFDVSTDQEKAQEMIEKTNQRGVPAIVVTDENGKEEIIIGFDEERLKEVLNG